jgi:hypothetical protein
MLTATFLWPRKNQTTRTNGAIMVMSELIACVFGFTLMVAYWPGISGVAMTPRWDVAALLAVVLFFAPRVRVTAAHWLGLVLIAWLALSMLWNDGAEAGRLDGAHALLELVIGAIAFAVGSTLTNLRGVMIGAAIGIGVNSVVAIAQSYGWDGPIETIYGGYAGLFYNRDRLAAAAAVVAVGVVALPRVWLLLPLLLPSLILAPSRAAWLALATGCFVLSPFKMRSLIASIVIACFASMLFHGIDSSNLERFAIWRETIANLSFFGHGLGSFREIFPQVAQSYDFNHWQTRPEHPHNEWLWLAFEGGTPALGLGSAFALSVWSRADSASGRGVLAGLLVLSVFAMPFHDPATLVLGALCAGYLARGRDRVSDRAVDRGMALRAGVAANVRRARAF